VACQQDERIGKESFVKHFLPGRVRGIICAFLIFCNTVFWMFPLFITGFLKFVIPVPASRTWFSKAVTFVCAAWNGCNNTIFKFMLNVKWDIAGADNLKKNDSYLVLSNHQTWVDILVLENVFLGKIPFLKFFIKQELMWIPVLGFSWWALDYPVMKRYSKEVLEKNPHLKGTDLDTTRKACEKFKTMPVSVMNFAEGTRFTKEKHQRQQSPFKHLLRPKAGGTAFALNALSDHLHAMLNVTIVYPRGVKNLWEFLCGELDEVVVRIERMPIPRDILGNYDNDPEYRKHFQDWLNSLWLEKDKQIQRIIEQSNLMRATARQDKAGFAN
jgi:1-acyl-sn-glycerol-3-phosphate acyltransferase